MTRSLLPLRDYQAEAIRAIEQAWYGYELRRPAVVLPTGAGKTVIFAHLVEQMHARGVRSLILVHTNELVEQAVNKLHDVAPDLRVGVVKAERDEHLDAHVIVATVQTLRSERRRAPIENIGLIVVDECHHATAHSYREVLEHFGCFAETGCFECISTKDNEDPAPRCDCRSGERCNGPCRNRAHVPLACSRIARAVGFTATLARGDGAALGDIWQRVVYRQDILDMIRIGHLLPARGKRIRVPDLNLSAIRKVHGDYSENDLGEALTESLAPSLVAKAYMEHAPNRSGILFAPTVDSAHVFAQALCEAGIAAETIHGKTPAETRTLTLKRLKSGDVQVACNCMVLTEGFDEPRVSCAVIARPTTSAPLYTQMVGRILRPYPGQTDALVLDVVGVTGRHKLASLVDLIGDPTKRLRDDDIESLADMLLTADGLEFEGEERREGEQPASYVEGDEIEALDVDLFARSHRAWLRTPGGTWMLPAGKAYVFLAPAGGGGRWNVGVIGQGVAEFRYRRVNLDAAMSWGEEVVAELGGSALANRDGAWRRKGVPLRPAQVNMAQRLRIDIPDGISKGELSDLISVKIGGDKIDPLMKRWTR